MQIDKLEDCLIVRSEEGDFVQQTSVFDNCGDIRYYSLPGTDLTIEDIAVFHSIFRNGCDLGYLMGEQDTQNRFRSVLGLDKIRLSYDS